MALLEPAINLTFDAHFDGVPLQLSENVNLLNDGQQLHIEEAAEEDAGRYSCVAENLPGRAEKDLLVSLLRAPTTLKKVQYFEVERGISQTFVCPIQDFVGQIQWAKDGAAVVTSKHLQISAFGEKLHILRADSGDKGIYVCRASNEAGDAESTVEFVVLEPPRITGSSYRQQTTATNESVALDCHVLGTPTPNIVWHFDGLPLVAGENVEIVGEGQLLRIHGVAKHQEGRYTCVATNKVGKTEMDTFLDVHVRPMIQGASEELKVREGNGKSIRCEVEGWPTPQVEWRKNGAPFHSPLIHVANNVYSIHLQRATVADSGLYACVASNNVGIARKEFRVSVLVPPKIDEGERVLKVKENGSVTLECIASGVPPPTVLWRRDGRVLASEPRLELREVETKDAGRYTCEARNEADWSQADFAVDVLVKPRFRGALRHEVRVVEGDRATLECRADGKPTPTVRWTRGGRPLSDSPNLILSPRSEALMLLHARHSDAGLYACVVANAAGQSEASFRITVLSAPHIDETIDQNPRFIHSHPIVLDCPVLGNPEPEVEWRRDGAPLPFNERVTVVDRTHLTINNATSADAGRYTCHAENEVGHLDTDFLLEVIAPPKFGEDVGKTEYEVLRGASVTMTCPVREGDARDINWLRGAEPVYLSPNVKISADSHKLTIEAVDLSDGGRYTCRASNEAGSTKVPLLLKVLVPPEIDKSNIIQNPLAILGRSISLECPVRGIPQPSVLWTRDGIPVPVNGHKYLLDQNNQTFVLHDVQTADRGVYACVVENRGGATSQDFHLGVLIPPQMDSNEMQKVSKREGALVVFVCPVQRSLPGEDADGVQISWMKDGRPLDPLVSTRFNMTDHGRRLLLSHATLPDAGDYVCIASNQAGEVYVKFALEILCTSLSSERCRTAEHRHLETTRSALGRRPSPRRKTRRRPRRPDHSRRHAPGHVRDVMVTTHEWTTTTHRHRWYRSRPRGDAGAPRLTAVEEAVASFSRTFRWLRASFA
ncbi:hypothetical protein QR680_017436 [Steinernema hermaphroditum]|uniref:Ig-like domain-containing protein n=1 Tax=Steinernema hermaphroditum TaxID=289476 RepID=A0AA39HGQ0_9BILA|nr:hypothetical protein QR680_017436 [Steinernema hermaphroditum]